MKLTLVSHNVFWFQGAPFEGTAPGPARTEVLEKLARLYRSFKPQLVCLQEVQAETIFHQAAQALGLRGAYCSGGRYVQYGGATLYAKGRLAARAGRSFPAVERFWMKVALEECGPWRGLVAANVHLPSGRQSTAAAAAARRLVQLRALLDAAPRPGIVAGDFNERPGGAAHRLMEERGFRDAALLANAGNVGTAAHGGTKRGDFIWLEERLAERLAGYRVLPPEKLALGEGRFLSDHCPLVVSLE